MPAPRPTDVKVPKTIGVPMEPGMDLGLYVAWHNDTGKDLQGVQMTLRMLWTPKNQNPQPVNAMPIYMDVNLTVGGSNTFDVPPGRSEKAHEFILPVSGRLLGVGGHLHDYGVRVRLEDAEIGKLLAEVVATRDSAGKVSKVSRKLFGVTRRRAQAEGRSPLPGGGRIRESHRADPDQGGHGPHVRSLRSRRHGRLAEDRRVEPRLSAGSGVIAGREPRDTAGSTH